MTEHINVDGAHYEVVGKKVYSTVTGEEVKKVLVYPVKQAVWGGAPEVLYFPTAAQRDAYMAANDYCEKLPCCKVYSDRVTRSI